MDSSNTRSAIDRYKVVRPLDGHPLGLTFKVVDPDSQCYAGLKTFFDHKDVLKNGLDLDIVRALAKPRISDCFLSYYRFHPVRPEGDRNDDRPLLVTEWVEGVTVQELLRFRRTLTLPETRSILAVLAKAFDDVARAKLTFAVPALDEVMIAPLNSRQEFMPKRMTESLLRTEMTEWPQTLIKIDPIGRQLPQPFDNSGGQTVAAPQWPPWLAANSISRFAYLAYLLLGGRATSGSGRRLIGIPELGESKNELLQEAILNRRRSVRSLVDFVENL